MRNYFAIFRKIIIFASWYSAICWICSHTLRGCVDWNSELLSELSSELVTPFVGVWIETQSCYLSYPQSCVTPFVGVWIETIVLVVYQLAVISHTLRGCVDWNILRNRQPDSGYMSHPSWVCGLKLHCAVRCRISQMSHPSWVCGLKHIAHRCTSLGRSHTLRGCVDWNL